MSKTPEAKVKDEIRLVLDAVGAVYGMPIGSAYGRSNLCDFIVCLPGGRYMEIEAKAHAHSALRPNQKQKLAEVRRIGGSALVIHKDNLASLVDALAGELGRDPARIEHDVYARRESLAQQKKTRRTERRVIQVKEE